MKRETRTLLFLYFPLMKKMKERQVKKYLNQNPLKNSKELIMKNQIGTSLKTN